MVDCVKTYRKKQGKKKALQIQKEAIEEQMNIIDKCDWPQDESERHQKLRQLRKQLKEIDLKILDAVRITSAFEALLETVKDCFGEEHYDMFF